VAAEERTPRVDFIFEVDGVEITMSVLADDAPKILSWSTSEVILYLGQHGPLFQEGLRQALG
jgi:hypothetical protein